MIRKVLNTDIESIKLKAGQVITMLNSKDNSRHNMIVFPCKYNLCAVEELFSTDSITIDSRTGSNYCHLDQQKYPQTLGVSPEFGDTVIAIYPHLGYCSEDEVVMVITYYDENGILCDRSCII